MSINDKLTNKTIIVGSIANIFLAATKIIVGIFASSHALIADGIHSTSDLITDCLVYFAAKYGRQRADHDHPYGHRRIETIATTGIACTLILVACGIIYDALSFLSHHAQLTPSTVALVISMGSIVVNEWLFRYTANIAKRVKLDLLMANAWHHRSDAASSIVVFVGILGAILGYKYLDAIAAIIVGLMIIKMAINLGWYSVRELIDTSIDQDILDKITRLILSYNGVIALHQLRGRTMAGDIILDVHIKVAPTLTVSEGHFIGQEVKQKLLQAVNEIVDVTIHIDPEDDEFAKKTIKLKSRSAVLIDLKDCLSFDELYEQNEKINLHYLDGKIIVEIYFSAEICKDIENLYELSKKYTKAVSKLYYIQKIEIYCAYN